jgi:hypothetical protein
MLPLAALGLITLWVVRRELLGLVLAIVGGTLGVMCLQAVAPPPRILSFLSSLFALAVAAGVVGSGRLVFLASKPEEEVGMARQLGTLCSWLAFAVAMWGYFGSRNQPMPGGSRPVFLVEDIPSVWSRVDRPWTEPPETQLWRLDIRDAVELVLLDEKPEDRVLVGLPADLPFHFYAAVRGYTRPIGGNPEQGERLWLILRADEEPQAALRQNLSLQITDPNVLDRNWNLIASGELTVWRSLPSTGN